MSDMTMLKSALLDFPQPGSGRWTMKDIDRLKGLLNRYGLDTVSSAIGSIEFDLVDALASRAEKRCLTPGQKVIGALQEALQADIDRKIVGRASHLLEGRFGPVVARQEYEDMMASVPEPPACCGHNQDKHYWHPLWKRWVCSALVVDGSGSRYTCPCESTNNPPENA